MTTDQDHMTESTVEKDAYGRGTSWTVTCMCGWSSSRLWLTTDEDYALLLAGDEGMRHLREIMAPSVWEGADV